MIVALAGRRIDPPDAQQAHFPLANLEVVREKLRNLFEHESVQALVCSAANGADLLALEVAGELQISRHVILPFRAGLFRTVSVIDRPGQWGERFDRLISEIGAKEELVLLNCSSGNKRAFLKTNQEIFKRARRLAVGSHDTVLAVLVWNGTPAGQHDITLEFRDNAVKNGFPIHDILTV